MGIETLQCAARAAGFAMASSDEPLAEARRETEQTWLPKAQLLAQDVEPEADKAPAFGEWIKGMIGSTGRAPA